MLIKLMTLLLIIPSLPRHRWLAGAVGVAMALTNAAVTEGEKH